MASGSKRTDKPTVLLYGHYDVQPVDPIELWKSPTLRAGGAQRQPLCARRGGRQGADARAGQGAGIAHARRRRAAGQHQNPVRGRGGGGRRVHREVRRASIPRSWPATCRSSPIPACPRPASPRIIYSLRGILYTEIVAKGAKRDLHSGVFGGIAPNPLHALALVLAGLKGADGQIKIPGLYRAR